MCLRGKASDIGKADMLGDILSSIPPSDLPEYLEILSCDSTYRVPGMIGEPSQEIYLLTGRIEFGYDFLLLLRKILCTCFCSSPHKRNIGSGKDARAPIDRQFDPVGRKQFYLDTRSH